MKETLDIAGIRGYRTSEPPVPIHALLTSQRNRIWPDDSPGWPQSLDFAPFYALLGRIRMVDRDGVEETVTHLCTDVVHLLQGLEHRVEEYREFLMRLEELASRGDHPLLGTLAARTQALQRELDEAQVTPSEEVSRAVEAVRQCIGSGDELWDRDEFDRFRELSRSSLQGYQALLERCRGFAKEVRTQAGIAITDDPDAEAMAETIRKLTQGVLRNRYYLEGDWRGEEPLP